MGKSGGYAGKDWVAPVYLGRKPITTNMNDSTTPVPRTRPTLLTVLCILSFIAGAWAVISGLMSLTASPDTEALRQQMDQAMEGVEELGDDSPMAGFAQGMAEQAMKAAEAARPMGIANMIIALISIFGVWQMWNLKKTGFWIYVLASVAGLAVPMIFLGGGLLAVMSVGVGGFISLIFIILYALNLKHMS